MDRLSVAKRMACAVDDTACRIFADDCHINRKTYAVSFWDGGDRVLIQPWTKDYDEAIKQAVRLFYYRGDHIANQLKEWQIKVAEIKSPLPRLLQILAKNTQFNFKDNIMSEPLIVVPSLEIGDLSFSPTIQERIDWMMKNPVEVTGITRVFDEAQVVMSRSSAAALLTTTTLKQAVKRKRTEYWHRDDLFEFRIASGQYIKDLKAGLIRPEQTKHDRSWRCVSGNGTWRKITHEYTTFVDEFGIPYQFSRNVGVEKIDTPDEYLVKI